MSALTFIPNSFQVQYSTAFELAYQQMQSKLRDAVYSVNASGERYRDQIMDTVSTVDIITRGGDTIATDTTSSLPNIFPTPSEVVNRFDEWDQDFLAQVVLPGSEVAESQAAAVSRNIDDTLVSAFSGTAYRGKNGTTGTAFDTTNQQVAAAYGASGSTGLTFKKVAHAAKILDDGEVPEEDRYLGVRSGGMEDLVNDILANHSNDMASIQMIEGSNRVLKQILGFKVIQCQRWSVDGSDICNSFAWHKKAMMLGMWTDRKTYMDILPTKRHSLQIRTVVNKGATRRKDPGVVSILVDQSP